MNLIDLSSYKIETILINIYFLVTEITDIDKYHEIHLFIIWNMVRL